MALMQVGAVEVPVLAVAGRPVGAGAASVAGPRSSSSRPNTAATRPACPGRRTTRTVGLPDPSRREPYIEGVTPPKASAGVDRLGLVREIIQLMGWVNAVCLVLSHRAWVYAGRGRAQSSAI